MAPKESGVFARHGPKAFPGSPQAADVLRGDVADLAAPGFVRIFRGRGVGFGQRLPPRANDASFIPVGGADQSLPLAQITLCCFVEDRRFHAALLLLLQKNSRPTLTGVS